MTSRNKVRWLLDSGSCFDIIGQNGVASMPGVTLETVDDPIIIETANGVIEAYTFAKCPLGS